MSVLRDMYSFEKMPIPLQETVEFVQARLHNYKKQEDGLRTYIHDMLDKAS